MMATREGKIIDETIKFVAKHGLPEFSTKELAKVVGCSETLIYKYFRTKDLLIERCIDYIAEWHIATFHERVMKAVEGCTTDNDIAEAIFRTFLKMYGDFQDLTMFYIRIRVSKYNVALYDAIARIEEEHYQTFVEVVERENATLQLNEELGRFIFETASAIASEFCLQVELGEVEANDETYDKIVGIMMNGMRTIYYQDLPPDM